MDKLWDIDPFVISIGIANGEVRYFELTPLPTRVFYICIYHNTRESRELYGMSVCEELK